MTHPPGGPLMTAPTRTEPRTGAPTINGEHVPPLRNGDHLDRVEFERRYDAMPGVKKAELVEGVVYMPSPVRLRHHGIPHSKLVTWLGIYQAGTPHVEVGDNSSVRLDTKNMPQPDALLLIDPERGG